MKPIYLDYAATTPVDPAVAEVMMKYLTQQGIFGNPASRFHHYGWQAEEVVEVAREQVAQLLGAQLTEIIFTSGATESINLALKGTAQAYAKAGKKNHIITCATEHQAALGACQALETAGFRITYLFPRADGLLDLTQLKAALEPATCLVSILHVNNEIGVIQDMMAITTICQQAEVILHVDATQSVGKVTLDLATLPIDLLSFSAHKIYGPKGIGVLFIRRTLPIQLVAQQHGGAQERNLRGGTLPVHQIAALGKACQIAQAQHAQERLRVSALTARFWQTIQQALPMVIRNGAQDELQMAPHIVSLTFPGIKRDQLLYALPELAFSSGSACNSTKLAPSHVLLALGMSAELAQSTFRFSFGRFSTEMECEKAAQLIIAAVKAHY